MSSLMRFLSGTRRQRVSSIAIVVIAMLIPPAMAAAPAAAPIFKAGFAERDITPDIGMEQPGGYRKVFHRTLHDPCKVRAAVFDDGSARIAIVALDALLIRRPLVDAARTQIARKTQIPPQAILIAASHTHSGGPTGMVLPGEYDDAPELVKSLAYEKSSCADAKYLARVQQAIIDAVIDADEHRANARAAAGFGVEASVSFNRRFKMTSGQVFTHPGQGNPDIVEPAGPIDPQVGVVGVWDAQSKLIGCIVNFACHATTGPGGISADYICYCEKAIRGLLGPNVIMVFLAGTAGDVTQVNNRSPWQIRQSGEQSCRFVGGRVGAEAAKVLLSIQPSAAPLQPIAFSQRILQIKRRVPSPEHLARALEIVQKAPDPREDPTSWTFAKETVLLDYRLKKEPVGSVEVQALQLGPAVFLCCPAEAFCQIGLDLKAGSKFPFTFPVSLANDCVGYVPTAEALGPHGGGYETRLTAYTNLEPAAAQIITGALLDMSRQFTPAPAPQPPPLPPFKGKPWSYGNLPAQLE